MTTRLAVAASLLIAVAACGGGSKTAADTSSTAAAAAPRVVALMSAAHCTGKVIGTQLYTVETGRCTMPGGEVTVAAFSTNTLRDQWLKAGAAFGGTPVHGDRWAAIADGPDDAPAFAASNP